MSRLMLTTILFLSSAATMSAQALHLTPTKCPRGIDGIAGCPLDGCGAVSDALLNDAKNRTDMPSGDVTVVEVPDIVAFEEPSDWLTGQERTELSALEGRPVRLMGYLKIVKKETSGESCNCELHKQVDTDLHLVIVEHKNDAESDSVTAEITPRVRVASHPQWSFAQIGSLRGKYVRLTGWLLLDTGHLHHSKLANEQEHNPSSLTRATNWEVHPVMKFEVCGSSVKTCKNGTGWKPVN